MGPLNTTQNIWHILSIPSPLSPAHLAGLLPYSDYILGTPSGTLRGEGALGELVEDHLNRSLVLWVYNSEFDVVREVELIPRKGWGGEGALGAVLGFGALHRLPVGLGEEMQAPGEKMFEAEQRASVESAQTENDAKIMVPTESSAAMQQQPPVFVSPNLAPLQWSVRMRHLAPLLMELRQPTAERHDIVLELLLAEPLMICSKKDPRRVRSRTWFQVGKELPSHRLRKSVYQRQLTLQAQRRIQFQDLRLRREKAPKRPEGTFVHG